MVQYAAIAGKVPLMLKREDDSPLEELIPDQANLGITFSSMNDLIEEALRLLEDQNYRCKKENLIQHSIVSEAHFIDQLNKIILTHNTDYLFVNEINTNLDLIKFRESYRRRFNREETYLNAIMRHWALRIKHPGLLLKRLYDKIRCIC